MIWHFVFPRALSWTVHQPGYMAAADGGHGGWWLTDQGQGDKQALSSAPAIDFSSEVSAWYGSSQGRPATKARASRLLAWKGRCGRRQYYRHGQSESGIWYVHCKFMISCPQETVQKAQRNITVVPTFLTECYFVSSGNFFMEHFELWMETWLHCLNSAVVA